jgi:hypothetical protein
MEHVLKGKGGHISLGMREPRHPSIGLSDSAYRGTSNLSTLRIVADLSTNVADRLIGLELDAPWITLFIQ